MNSEHDETYGTQQTKDDRDYQRQIGHVAATSRAARTVECSCDAKSHGSALYHVTWSAPAVAT